MPNGQDNLKYQLGPPDPTRRYHRDPKNHTRTHGDILEAAESAQAEGSFNNAWSTKARNDDGLQSRTSQIIPHMEQKDLIYFPAYCHKTSPTWFEWVKLTALDIHTKLHVRDGYQHSWLAEHHHRRDPPQLMFYLNHPIQFVQVVGVVVSFDEYFEHFWLFTLDDSSGSTIDVVCQKPLKEKEKSDATHGALSDTFVQDRDEEQKEIIQLSSLVSENVEIGAVLQVKGVITLFQRKKPAYSLDSIRRCSASEEPPVRQVALKRLTKLHDTNQEIKIIAARTAFHKRVLTKAWRLSEVERCKLKQEALGESEHSRKKADRLAERAQRQVRRAQEDERTIQEDYIQAETIREEQAEEARQAGLRLAADLEKKRKEQPEEKGCNKEQPPNATVEREADKDTSDGKREKRQKKRRKKSSSMVVGGSNANEQHDTTNDSFAALDEEKSALLKAAFG